jgi:hypothetical protein
VLHHRSCLLCYGFQFNAEPPGSCINHHPWHWMKPSFLFQQCTCDDFVQWSICRTFGIYQSPQVHNIVDGPWISRSLAVSPWCIGRMPKIQRECGRNALMAQSLSYKITMGRRKNLIGRSKMHSAVPWSLVTLLSGHLWPYSARSLATLLSGHLRPYPFNNSHPPCVPPYNGLHSTSLLKLLPLRST